MDFRINKNRLHWKLHLYGLLKLSFLSQLEKNDYNADVNVVRGETFGFSVSDRGLSGELRNYGSLLMGSSPWRALSTTFLR